MSALIGKTIDNVVDKMDLDRIIEKIDIDRIIDRIDLDRHIARVDINAILERADINAVLERSNLEEIVARSSSSIVNQMIDTMRLYIVKLDLLAYRIGKCACAKKEIYVPPKPVKKGRNSTDGTDPSATMTKTMSTLIVRVQGAYCGVVSRGVSWVIDELVSLLSFAVITLFMETIAQIISRESDFKIDPLVLFFVFLGWDVHLRILCLLITRRTLGMGIVGLTLVNLKGRRPPWYLIFLRQYLQPGFSKIPLVNMLSCLLALCRSDGRFPHDLLSCTGCVYRWNVSMTKVRLASRERKKKNEDNDDDDSSPAFYDFIP